MKLCYDSTEDCLRVVFTESGVRSDTMGGGVTLVYTEEGHLAELVVRDVMAHAGNTSILRQIVLEGFSPGDKGGAILIVPRLLKQFNLLDEHE